MVDDGELVSFLQRNLPQLSLRYRGFVRVRGQVAKRLARRLRELSLPGLAAYEALIHADPAERKRLDGMCRITISRFARDRAVWNELQARLLPALCRRARAAGREQLRALSAGCASGEEPYSLALLWALARPHGCEALTLRIDAIDADAQLLERARRACYPRGTLRELDPSVIERAFEPHGDELRLREAYRVDVTLMQQDIRVALPEGPYDLALARNLPFTYFDAPLQWRVLQQLHARMFPGGVLIIGAHEQLPAGTTLFEPVLGAPASHVRREGGRVERL